MSFHRVFVDSSSLLIAYRDQTSSVMDHCRMNTDEGRTDCFPSVYQISVRPRLVQCLKV